MQLGNAQLGSAQLGGTGGGGGAGPQTNLFAGEAWLGAVVSAELDVNRSVLRVSQHTIEVWGNEQASPVLTSQHVVEAWGNEQASPVSISQIVLEVFSYLAAPVSLTGEAWLGGVAESSLRSMLFFASEACIGAAASATLNQRFSVGGEVWVGAVAEGRLIQTQVLRGEAWGGALAETEKLCIFNTFFGEAVGGAVIESVPAFTVFKYWNDANALGGALPRGIIDFVAQIKFCVEVVPELVAVSSVIPLMPVALITDAVKLIAGVELSVCAGSKE